MNFFAFKERKMGVGGKAACLTEDTGPHIYPRSTEMLQRIIWKGSKSELLTSDQNTSGPRMWGWGGVLEASPTLPLAQSLPLWLQGVEHKLEQVQW